MAKRRNRALLAFSGLALFLAGGVLGFVTAERSRGLFPTEAFIEERLAECEASVALYRWTEASPRARRAIRGDLAGCNVMLEAWHGQIAADHREAVDGIRAAYRQAKADQAAGSR